ncbi:MAG: PH domain-containing protein [Candidatus Micrarchaeia archaeon]
MAERHLDSRVKIAWLLPVYIFALILPLVALVAYLALPAGEQSGLYPAMTNGGLIISSLILAELITLLPSLVWAQLKFRAFTYSFTPNELVIRDGIITRQRIVVPYERIQEVFTERTLRDRILSLATLRIQTAAREAKEFNIVIPGIAYDTRDAIISDIMSHVIRKRGGTGLGADEEENDKVSRKELAEMIGELRQIRELLGKSSGPSKEEKAEAPAKADEAGKKEEFHELYEDIMSLKDELASKKKKGR